MSSSLHWIIVIFVAHAIILLMYLGVTRVRRTEKRKRGSLMLGLEFVMLPVLLVPQVDMVRAAIVFFVVIGVLFLTEVIAWPAQE